MKTVIVIASFVLALIVIGATSFAQEDKGHGKHKGPKAEMIIEKMDADKNGSISKSEAKDMHEKRTEKMAEKGKEMNPHKSIYENFDEIDTDKSGDISLTELKADIEKRKPSAENFVKKFDTNADNKLSKDEALAAKEDKIAKIEKRKEKFKEHSLFSRFDEVDTDKNGELSTAELDADLATKPEHKHGDKKKPAGEGVIKHLDTDNNGTVSKDEAEAHHNKKLEKAEEHKKHNIYDEFDEIDTDKDDFLTSEELKAFKEKKKAEREKKDKKEYGNDPNKKYKE